MSKPLAFRYRAVADDWLAAAVSDSGAAHSFDPPQCPVGFSEGERRIEGATINWGTINVDAERLALDREIQACQVRLELLPPFGQEPRNETFRDELRQKRDDATRRLAQLDTDAVRALVE